MALPERNELFPEEIKIDTFLDKGTVFFVYCRDCEKTLYCAQEDTKITRRVAELTIDGHSHFFGHEHRVILIRR